MASPVAIVTGGSSGIGLALVQHLVSLGWRVIIADLSPPPPDLPLLQNPDANATFIHTDISSWDQQVAMFAQAYAWGGQRLDFCALNAGISDSDDIFESLSRDANDPPKKPDLKTWDVNLTGTYYGVKLAAHYMTLPSAAKPYSGGKVVITASGTGLFPMPALPVYSTSKHGLVGLARCLGRHPSALRANVRVNAVCPAIVDTPIVPRELVALIPPNQITPMETIVRCFDEIADLSRLGEMGEKAWVEGGRAGDVVEGNGHELIWHEPPAPKQGGGLGGDGGSAPTGLHRDQAAVAVMEVFREAKLRALREREEKDGNGV